MLRFYRHALMYMAGHTEFKYI